jgi:NADPH-ferrihemoprotein reductase
VFFYGSQTGTAERLASLLAKDAQTRFGIDGIVADLDDFEYDDLLSLPESMIAIFLLATYGEGEPTDNCIAFNRFCAAAEGKRNSDDTTLHYRYIRTQ